MEEGHRTLDQKDGWIRNSWKVFIEKDSSITVEALREVKMDRDGTPL